MAREPLAEANGRLTETMSRSERLRHAASKQPELAEDLLAVDPIVFNWGIFIRQTLYHALAPFTAPLVYFESPVLARNQGFIGLTPIYFVLNYILHFLALSVLIVYFYGVGLDNERVTRWEMLVPMLAHLLRHAAIGIKYAFMPRLWYERFLTVPMTPLETSSFLLLGGNGWMWLPKSTIHREIKRAAIRVDLDLNREFVLSDQPLSTKRVSVATGAVSETDDATMSAEWSATVSTTADVPLHAMEDAQQERISVCDLLMTIMSETRRGPNADLRVVSLLPAVTTAFIPVVMRVGRDQPPFGSGAAEIYVVIAVILLNLALLGTAFNFLAAGFNDMRRRRDAYRFVGDLVAREPLTRHALASPEFARLIGRIDLGEPRNVGLWLNVHRAINVFGLDFLHRLLAVVVISLVFAVILLLIIAFQLIAGGFVSGHGVVLTSVVTFLTTAHLLSITSLAIAANREVGEHILAVLRTKMALQQRAVEMDPIDRDFIQRTSVTASLLDTAKESLSALELYEPIRILGVRATSAIYSSILSGAVAVMGLSSAYVIDRYRQGKIAF